MLAQLDPERLAERQAILADIRATERAEPPEADLLRDALNELAIAVQRYQDNPFGTGVPPGAVPNPLTARLRQLGEHGFYDPEKTRALIEQDVHRRVAASRALRLTRDEREHRLADLRHRLRICEAQLERQRREIEAFTDAVLPRNGYDPATWLLVDDDLLVLASGTEPPPPTTSMTMAATSISWKP